MQASLPSIKSRYQEDPLNTIKETNSQLYNTGNSQVKSETPVVPYVVRRNIFSKIKPVPLQLARNFNSLSEKERGQKNSKELLVLKSMIKSYPYKALELCQGFMQKYLENFSHSEVIKFYDFVVEFQGSSSSLVMKDLILNAIGKQTASSYQSSQGVRLPRLPKTDKKKEQPKIRFWNPMFKSFEKKIKISDLSIEDIVVKRKSKKQLRRKKNKTQRTNSEESPIIGKIKSMKRN